MKTLLISILLLLLNSCYSDELNPPCCEANGVLVVEYIDTTNTHWSRVEYPAICDSSVIEQQLIRGVGRDRLLGEDSVISAYWKCY